MSEIRMEVSRSGRAPNWRPMAAAFGEFLIKMRQDPEEEARYQAWLKEYLARREQH